MTDPSGAAASAPRPVLHIVTFNSAGAISTCLESLIKHAHGAAILVVDNGSEDESAEIVEEFSARAMKAMGSADGIGAHAPMKSQNSSAGS